MRNFRPYFMLIAIIMFMSSFCINHLPASEVRVNRLCPVDFKKITPDARYPYTYEDKIYFFHSLKCIEEFKKDPEGHLKAWEKKERFYKINIIYD